MAERQKTDCPSLKRGSRQDKEEAVLNKSIREPLSLQEVTEEILRIEGKENLFDLEVDGVPVWERIRVNIPRRILQERGVIEAPHSSRQETRRGELMRYARALVYAVTKNPFFADQQEVFIFGSKRRKKRRDGIWEDVYFDPVMDVVDRDMLLVEGWSSREGKHRKPPASPNIRYLDPLYLAISLEKRLPSVAGSMDLKIPTKVENALHTVSKEIKEIYDVQVDLVSMARSNLVHRARWLPWWCRLLRAVGPKVALLVTSYGKETFIEACQEQGIPTVELQHGVISTEHLAYHYPGNRDKRFAPDHFFVWGNYWETAAALPPASNVRSVGYPYFERERERYRHIDPDHRILFISQNTIGKKLSRIACRLANLNDDHEIVFKLHPTETANWAHDYPGLEASSVMVVEEDQPPLYDLIASSKCTVGANSTVLYEALGFGRPIILLDFPGSGYERFAALFDYPAVSVAEDAMDINRVVERQKTDSLGVNYELFARDAAQRVREGVERILAKDRQ